MARSAAGSNPVSWRIASSHQVLRCASSFRMFQTLSCSQNFWMANRSLVPARCCPITLTGTFPKVGGLINQLHALIIVLNGLVDCHLARFQSHLASLKFEILNAHNGADTNDHLGCRTAVMSTMERASFSSLFESMPALISLTRTISVSLMLKTKSFCLSGKRF